MTPDPLQNLLNLLGEHRLLTEPSALAHYGKDWTRFADPAPSAVLLPESTEEVQAIVSAARVAGIPIVPSGGRTGLSGGAMATNGEWVLSLERMNKILGVDAVGRSLHCQAGAITADIQRAAVESGLFYPVDFASSGSSQIGGNIATNAGGIRVIRYGMTRDWVTGVTAVTGTGDILALNRGLIKNNSGVDLRHLMIGSEGTLGVITEATLRLTSAPKDPAVVVMGLPSMHAVMAVLRTFQDALELMAFEFFSELALDKVVKHRCLQRPFNAVTPFYVLLEFDRGEVDSQGRLESALAQSMEQHGVVDAVISQSQTQYRNLWRLREDISETIAQWFPYKNDLSTTVAQVPDFLHAIDSVVTKRYPDLEVIWYGHIGDGNLHLNILKPEGEDIAAFQARCADVNDEIFAEVAKLGGSISAEHGIGLLKKPYLGITRSIEEIEIMRAIKRSLDPDNILNPGKVFDS